MSKDLIHPTRGLATATYSGLAVVGLAALALVGATSPVSAAAHEGEGAYPSSAAAQRDVQGQPPFATRARARRVAWRLLATVVLPPGTHRFAGRRLPGELRQPAELTSAVATVDLHRVFAEQRSMRGVIEFLDHHHPAGMSADGTGEAFNIRHGRDIVTEEDVTYVPDHLAPPFSAIEMVVQTVPGRRGHALTRVDVQVVFYPRRSAAEHLVASHFRAVTINGWSAGTSEGYLQRTFRQRAIIDKLARVLNSLPASPGGWESCPAIFATYALTFKPVKGQAGATVTVPGCFAYNISTGGQSQPSLVDNGKIETIAQSLLAFRPTDTSGPTSTPAR
jgi:hypothetical protein